MKKNFIISTRSFVFFNHSKRLVIVVAVLLAFVSSCDKQSEEFIKYTEDVDGIFCNPERGWHWTFNQKSFKNCEMRKIFH